VDEFGPESALLEWERKMNNRALGWAAEAKELRTKAGATTADTSTQFGRAVQVKQEIGLDKAGRLERLSKAATPAEPWLEIDSSEVYWLACGSKEDRQLYEDAVRFGRIRPPQ
jgi:hypothetical protein